MRLSRRNFRIALLAFVAASLVVILLALDHVISHRRWPVKTLTDADRGRVVRDPVDTTVAFLSSLPRVPGPLPHDRRIPPYEVTVYRVRAKLVAVHKMLDGDFHMVIATSCSTGSRSRERRLPPAGSSGSRSGRERERAPSPGRADSGRRRGSLSEARS
jgi:hypothetical protein